ncbi:MAG: hypothetical protein Q8P90_02590 [bacterium]|nr:hypothetical protein [bacterium]
MNREIQQPPRPKYGDKPPTRFDRPKPATERRIPSPQQKGRNTEGDTQIIQLRRRTTTERSQQPGLDAEGNTQIFELPHRVADQGEPNDQGEVVELNAQTTLTEQQADFSKEALARRDASLDELHNMANGKINIKYWPQHLAEVMRHRPTLSAAAIMEIGTNIKKIMDLQQELPKKEQAQIEAGISQSDWEAWKQFTSAVELSRQQLYGEAPAAKRAINE